MKVRLVTKSCFLPSTYWNVKEVKRVDIFYVIIMNNGEVVKIPLEDIISIRESKEED